MWCSVMVRADPAVCQAEGRTGDQQPASVSALADRAPAQQRAHVGELVTGHHHRHAEHSHFSGKLKQTDYKRKSQR